MRCGASELPDHNLLEMLLFYAIPRRDTNELAHIILKKTGSLKTLFSATKTELKEKYGLTEHLAEYIIAVGRLCGGGFDGTDASCDGTETASLETLFKSENLPWLTALFMNGNGDCLAVLEYQTEEKARSRKSINRLVAAASRADVAEVMLARRLADEESDVYAAVEAALSLAGISVSECVFTDDGKLAAVKRREAEISL